MEVNKTIKTTASRIAAKNKTEYNTGKGADIATNRMAIAVATPETVDDAMKSLRGFRKPVYIAGTNKEAVKIALEITEGTTTGVMDKDGEIVKRSKRKRPN
ncbi:MAG: hypothetical protein IH874_07720 [Candidatus Dadabacteria bacterium]|nr:hypothetical protein [Candidatus Dadabacteria bacterium]